MTGVFDPIADAYDGWYDSPEGRDIFHAERECLRKLHSEFEGRWLEIGVGTGRFAAFLGVSEGLDPSLRMLEIAARRGIRTYRGSAENLPFEAGSRDGVLMVVTLCFVDDARKALGECRRVLRRGGFFLLGIVPADGPWGREYGDKASRGHPVYSAARIRTARETVELVEGARFSLVDSASTLFWKPGESPQGVLRIERGIVPEAGFLGLLFEAV